MFIYCVKKPSRFLGGLCTAMLGDQSQEEKDNIINATVFVRYKYSPSPTSKGHFGNRPRQHGEPQVQSGSFECRACSFGRGKNHKIVTLHCVIEE